MSDIWDKKAEELQPLIMAIAFTAFECGERKDENERSSHEWNEESIQARRDLLVAVAAALREQGEMITVLKGHIEDDYKDIAKCDERIKALEEALTNIEAGGDVMQNVELSDQEVGELWDSIPLPHRRTKSFGDIERLIGKLVKERAELYAEIWGYKEPLRTNQALASFGIDPATWPKEET